MQVDLQLIVQADFTVVTYGAMQRRFTFNLRSSPYLAISDGTVLSLRNGRAGAEFVVEVPGRAKVTFGKHPEGKVKGRVKWIVHLKWRQTMRSMWIVPGEGSVFKVEHHKFR